ncbi:hypothetical protein EF888_07315 [Silicimonas algicola]|uniref:Uncharacterized protein n=1 Tax=Silicimonas algicola TaxID=1826607 RepID=A0A316G3M3_9RHOB|nr:hypothetical protein [Silicimonas algicola]AZQ66961.1 hypothetical protein EF888_07315 [Silicimonas algicola]PWK55531.1 hypothetical protein C8D95_107197 [Silicimonas algicola]
MNEYSRFDVRRSAAFETLKSFHSRDEAQDFARKMAIAWKADMTVTTVTMAHVLGSDGLAEWEF